MGVALYAWLARLEARQRVPLAFLAGIGAAIGLFLAVQLVRAPAVFLQTLMKSLGLGSVYALIALGFVLIFKATQTVNFAQGALAASGALFLAFLVHDSRIIQDGKSVVVRDGHIPFTNIASPFDSLGGASWLRWAIAVAVALAFAAAVGLVVERLAIRPMIGKPLFSVAVITLGLEIMFRVFNNDAVEVDFRPIGAPWGLDGFTVAGAFINWSFIAAMIAAALAFIAVYLFYRSRLGIAMRAVAFDQEAALAQGVSVGRVFAIAWAAGAVLAAIGGIFATQPPVAQTLSVGDETANIAFRALPAVILGGLDSATGALLGGLIVGAAEIYAGQYAAGQISWLGAGYPLIVPYVVMMIGLLVRPYGLFGTEEIRRV